MPLVLSETDLFPCRICNKPVPDVEVRWWLGLSEKPDDEELERAADWWRRSPRECRACRLLEGRILRPVRELWRQMGEELGEIEALRDEWRESE